MSLPTSSRRKPKIALQPGIEEEAVKVMEKFIEQLTTTGKEVLDTQLVKPMLERATASGQHLELFSELLFRQMEMEHAQIRYSSLLILDELIKISEHFRKELFFSNDKDFLMRLIQLTIIQGTTHAHKKGKAKKLRPQFVAVKLKAKALEFIQNWSMDYDDSRDCRFNECLAYIVQNLGIDIPIPAAVDAPSSTSTLLPSIALDILRREFETKEEEMTRTLSEIKSCFSLLVPKFETPTNMDSEEGSSEDGDEEEGASAHVRPTSSVPVLIVPNGLIKLRRTEDNEAILENLLGLYKLITNRFIPLIDSWLKSNDFENDPVLEERMEEIKSRLDYEKSRYERLHIKSRDESDSTDSDSEDSDLEEVGSQPEWMSIPCLAKPQAGDNASLSSLPPASDSSSICGSDDVPVPSRISSRQSCRAPLGNGKLCPRHDLLKCPFHGKIIRRDEQGNPIDPADIEAEAKRRMDIDAKKKPDWQDPTFLKELKTKIGMDLTIRKGRKGKKTFEERYPGLISLRQTEDSSRKRLARKLATLQGNARKRRRVDDRFLFDAKAPVVHNN